MNHTRTARHSPIPSLKLLDYQKHGTIVKSTKNLSHDGAKSRRLSISITPLDQLKQQVTKTKGLAVQSEAQTGRNVETKFDLNFPMSGISSIANYDYLESYYRGAKIEPDSGVSSILLPKLTSNGLDTRHHIKKNIKKSLPSLSSDLSKANMTARPSIRAFGRKQMELPEEKDFDKLRETNSVEDKPHSPADLIDETAREGLDAEKRVAILKTQAKNMKSRIKNLEKENQELRGMVKMYRDMVSKNSLAELEFPLREKGIGSSDLDGSKSTRSLASNKPQAVRSIDVGIHERLGVVFKTFARFRSMYYTMDAVVTEACKAFDCGYARVLLIDDIAKKMYHGSGGEKNKTEKVLLGRTEIEVIERKEDALADITVFNGLDSVEALKRMFNSDRRGISCPIYSTNNEHEVLGVIQICEPMLTTKHDKTKKKTGFSIRDGVLLGTYARVISLLIESHHWEWKMKEFENRISQYNDSMTQMVNTRNQQDLLEIFKTKLAQYFDFEHAGLLFYEPKEEHMYTFNIQRKQDGRFYSNEALMYSSKYGISGKCISQNIDILTLNEPRKSKSYQPDVDNTSAAAVVKNMIVGLLKNERGHKLGVVQLLNKRNGEDINEKDELAVRSLQKLLGGILAHVNDIQAAVSLSTAMSKTMKNIEETLNP